MKGRFPLTLLSCLATCSFADLVDVTLNLTPASPTENTLNLEVQVPVLGDDSDTSEVSGSIQARIEIDPETGTISSLEFLSGSITGTPVSFSSSAGILGSYNISSSVLGGTLDTPAPPAPMSGGQSAAELHEFTINSGTLTGSASVFLGGTSAIDENFSNEPITGSGAVGDFVTLSSTANAASSTPSLAVYDLDLSYPIEITETVESVVAVTFLVSGNFRATGQVSIPVTPPNPYLVWADTNGIANAPFEGNDFSSVLPNGLFWALGYNAGETVCFYEVREGNGRQFFFKPAPGGTAAEIEVEGTNDLSDPNSWFPFNSIPAGTTSQQLYGFGATSPQGFFRLSVQDPAI